MCTEKHLNIPPGFSQMGWDSRSPPMFNKAVTSEQKPQSTGLLAAGGDALEVLTSTNARSPAGFHMQVSMTATPSRVLPHWGKRP